MEGPRYYLPEHQQSKYRRRKTACLFTVICAFICLIAYMIKSRGISFLDLIFLLPALLGFAGYKFTVSTEQFSQREQLACWFQYWHPSEKDEWMDVLDSMTKEEYARPSNAVKRFCKHS